MNDPIRNGGRLRTVELTTRELRLLSKYGYPFPEQQEVLRASKPVNGYHRVRIDSYWIEMMSADVSRSAREIDNRALLRELDGLCSVLDRALSLPVSQA